MTGAPAPPFPFRSFFPHARHAQRFAFTPEADVESQDAERRILHEERVYADVFPLVRMYRGFWLGAAVMFGVMALAAVFLWWLYPEAPGTAGASGEDAAASLVTLVFYMAFAVWLSDSFCRMSSWVGGALLVYCVPALVLCGVMAIGALLALTDAEMGLLPVLIGASMLVFVVPFSYFCVLGVRAGRRFLYVGDETRRIVAEFDPGVRPSRLWLSRILGLPVSVEHLRRRGVLPVGLFLVSGTAFAAFGVFGPFAFAFASAPILVGTVFGFDVYRRMAEPGPGQDEALGVLLAVMAYSPFILLGLAAVSLGVGLAARARARRLTVELIRETQEQDPRPPLLFLRSFRDDQVLLPTPRLPLLGRLLNLFQARTSLDVVLLEEGTEYGPVVAVGKPDDPRPPYGASRGYFVDGDWRGAVERLADDSRSVAVCADLTEGVLWELEHVVWPGRAQKTLFLAHPAFRDPERNRAPWREVLARAGDAAADHPELAQLAASDVPVIGLFFDRGGQARVGVSRDFSEASYLLMVRWFLRSAPADAAAPALRPAGAPALRADAVGDAMPADRAPGERQPV